MVSIGERTGWWRLLAFIGAPLVVAAVVIFLIPIKEVAYAVTEQYPATETYYETETHTTTQDKSSYLFADFKFNLVSGKKVYHADIDITDKSDIVVSGYLILRDFLVDYTFYVVDEADYLEHSIYIEYPPNNPYVAIAPTDHNTNNAFSFVPDHSDTYYFVITTTEINYEYTTGGLIEFGASWEWQETIVETEVVLKERTVMKEKSVTRYKTVTLWDYFMNY